MSSLTKLFNHLTTCGSLVAHAGEIKIIYSVQKVPKGISDYSVDLILQNLDGEETPFKFIKSEINKILSVIPITEPSFIESYQLLFNTAKKHREMKMQEKIEEINFKQDILKQGNVFVKLDNVVMRVRKSSVENVFVLDDIYGGTNIFTFDLASEKRITLLDSEQQETWAKTFSDAAAVRDSMQSFKQREKETEEPNQIAENLYEDEEFKHYFDSALVIVGIKLSNEAVTELVIRIFEEVKRLRGEFSLRDASKIFVAVKKKYPNYLQPSPVEEKSNENDLLAEKENSTNNGNQKNSSNTKEA